MKKKFRFEVEFDTQNNIYVIRVPSLPGCVTHGHTLEEAMLNKEKAINAWIITAFETGREVPED